MCSVATMPLRIMTKTVARISHIDHWILHPNRKRRSTPLDHCRADAFQALTDSWYGRAGCSTSTIFDSPGRSENQLSE